MLGKATGALIGGKLINDGRRHVFITCNLLAICSSLLQQILNIRILVVGKLLNGIFLTIVHMCVITMINETVPPHLTGQYGIFIQISISTGFMLSFVFGLGFPEHDYNPELPKID